MEKQINKWINVLHVITKCAFNKIKPCSVICKIGVTMKNEAKQIQKDAYPQLLSAEATNERRILTLKKHT